MSLRLGRAVARFVPQLLLQRRNGRSVMSSGIEVPGYGRRRPVTDTQSQVDAQAVIADSNPPLPRTIKVQPPRVTPGTAALASSPVPGSTPGTLCATTTRSRSVTPVKNSATTARQPPWQCGEPLVPTQPAPVWRRCAFPGPALFWSVQCLVDGLGA